MTLRPCVRHAFAVLSAGTAAVLICALPASPPQATFGAGAPGVHAPHRQQGSTTWPGAAGDSSDPDADEQPYVRTVAVSAAGAGR